ncbi:MAG: hypothetical protein IT302_03400 [Dehalococcoidia bacterium]|nr:hypothetical protein [Dehalococcoidia bacterium]
MAKYLLVYHGGSDGSAEMSQEEGAKVMQAWTDWFASLGTGVADAGNPISRHWTITSEGTIEGGAADPATGYSVLEAENMDAALVMAKGCPHLASGGSIELAETFEIAM